MALLGGNLLSLSLLFAICFVVMNMANGACCPARGGGWWNKGTCGDCTQGTPCCGYHPCNVFCCGCDCRTGSCGKRRRRSVDDTSDMSAYLTFKKLDTNRNGAMEKFEFVNALEPKGITDNKTIHHHWFILDDNKDGIITLIEFDKRR